MMRLKDLLFAVFILAVFILAVHGAEWCNKLDSCHNKVHIECENPNEEYAPSCPKNTISMDVNLGAKDDILHMHNQLRNRVAGGGLEGYDRALYMATMAWSNVMERLARMNVKRCRLGIDGCRNTGSSHFVGQMQGRYEYPEGMRYKMMDMVRSIINLWFSDHRKGNMSYIRKYPASSPHSRNMRHFAQLVTDICLYIGCAGVEYTRDGITTFTLCCNYEHSFVPGYPVYEDGPQTKCDTGPNPKYTNLCNVGEEYTRIKKFQQLFRASVRGGS